MSGLRRWRRVGAAGHSPRTSPRTNPRSLAIAVRGERDRTERMAINSVRIVNFNSGDRLSRCLACLARQDFQDFETIVVDNASADGSASWAEAADVPVRLIRAETNLGFAAANNLAAKSARGEWLALLNPDAYARPDWLTRLAAAIDRYPWADAFGSTQLDAADPAIVDGAGDCLSAYGVYFRGLHGGAADDLPPDGECFAPCAAAAMYRRTTFETLGGFDERLFCYGEDVDLGWRLRLGGGRCVQVADAVVLHEGSGVTGRRSDFTLYHGHRNRLWVVYKNTPALLFWPFLPAYAAVNAALWLRFASLGSGGTYLKALRDGLAGLRQFSSDRRAIGAARNAAIADLARLMTRSPLAVHHRRPKLTPIAERK